METHPKRPPKSENLRIEKELEHSGKAIWEGLAPINRLPDPVLYTIFSYFQNECRVQPWKSLDWICVTHVCKEWRKVALDSEYATLWAFIPFHCPQWIPESIERSKSVMLTFEVLEDGVKYGSLKKLVKQHISRLQILKIHGGITEQQLQKLFDNLPAGSATQLECLLLPPDVYSGAIIAAAQRCLGATSSLKELETACSVDWTSPILNGLTHLTLSSGTTQPHGRPGQQHDFLRALQSMPLLRALHLGEGRLPIPENSSSEPTVNLRCLQSLRLSDSGVQVCNILRRLIFPGTVEPRLHFKIAQLDEIAEMVKILRGAFKSPNRPVIRRLKVRWAGSCIQVTGWTSATRSQEMEKDEYYDIEEHAEKDEEDCDFQIKVSWPTIRFQVTEEQKQAILVSISCVAVPVPSLMVLSLSASEPIFDLHKYFKVLGRQPELDTIFVEGPIFWPLLQSIALMSSPERDPPNYPSLRHLNVHSVLFYPKGHHHPLQDLQGILEVRKKYGMGLQSIHFSECHFLSQENIDALEKIIDKVTWDEMEIVLSDVEYEDEEDFENSEEDYEDELEDFEHEWD
ncbi:hypothetical protein M413DRAFT_408614 [Hebeloma cylindrosporum]|uniref:Uncharacterized protein n=1 Tax=Hebeloma cylindrosporum TaxID=76867 RepID=A0A0C3CGD7_HEBCY|nr:hypothetical protein M413DRAFT_408614 [Hebeloma cylindrosporum h7]